MMSCGTTIEAGASNEEVHVIDSVVENVVAACANSNEKDNFMFNFKLPEDGHALRSATFYDGVPELIFDASPKVPTITEEDVATVFRLVAEGKRPGFFYAGLPITNPLHISRLFMLYDPQWLRWTSVGKLLRDVDWLMKCVHVGTRSNEDKTAFQAWKNTSQLFGPIATRLDFPKDGSGPTIMSCESASVQKNDDEITFPEEPKMKITDGCSSLYSEYATRIYPSVAFYDEPRFLKMQEIIKLVLAVEWLYKEKGVRVSEEWVMKHTSKPTDKAEATKGEDSTTKEPNKPPYDMIPKPTHFKRPSSDVTVKTWEAEMYNHLRDTNDVEWRYGYYDFGGAEVIMFKEDGTPCPPRKCLKLGLECQFTIDGFPPLFFPFPKLTEWWYILLDELSTPTSALTKFKADMLKELPPSTCKEIAWPMPMSLDTKVEDSSNDSGVEVKVTVNCCPCPPLALPPLKVTTIAKATIDNYNMLYGGEDPNEPICPEIPGICEAIIPDVSSWDELISEMTVPIPRIWQAPYVGIGEPLAKGGVTTSDFRVKEEPLRSTERDGAVKEKGVFRGYGTKIGVRANRVRQQGSIRQVDRCSEEFATVCRKFSSKWAREKGPCPPVDSVYAITNSTREQKWNAYGRKVLVQDVEEYYHGTMLACNIKRSSALCNKGECGICGIANEGLDKTCISRDSFQRFGQGFYLAPNSSKAHDYTRTCNGQVYKAMLLCDVYPGIKHHFQRNKQRLEGPPPGCNSVYGQIGEDLNYPELVVYDADAVIARYIIVYRR